MTTMVVAAAVFSLPLPCCLIRCHRHWQLHFGRCSRQINIKATLKPSIPKPSLLPPIAPSALMPLHSFVIIIIIITITTKAIMTTIISFILVITSTTSVCVIIILTITTTIRNNDGRIAKPLQSSLLFPLTAAFAINTLMHHG